MSLKNQRGISLIEALVTGVISSVIAGAVISMMYLSTSQIEESSSRFSMQKLYDATAYQIGWTIREAAAVLAHGESFSNRLKYRNFIPVESFYTYDTDGNVTGGFGISSGILQEYDVVEGGFKPFVFGPDTVKVDSGAFYLWADRAAVELDVVLRHSAKDKEYTLAIRQERFRCRNSDL